MARETTPTTATADPAKPWLDWSVFAATCMQTADRSPQSADTTDAKLTVEKECPDVIQDCPDAIRNLEEKTDPPNTSLVPSATAANLQELAKAIEGLARARAATIPWEVCKACLTKTLGLASLQASFVLVVVLVADPLLDGIDILLLELIFFAAVLLSMMALLLLWWQRYRVPVNYILLIITTVLASVFWSCADGVVFSDDSNLSIQIQGIMVLVLLMCLVLVRANVHSESVFPSAGGLLLGWLCGVILNFTILISLGLPLLNGVFAAIAVLLSLIFLLGTAGKILSGFEPDEYMTLAVIMTFNLFLLVSIPLTLGFLSADDCFSQGSSSTTAPSSSALEVPEETNAV